MEWVNLISPFVATGVIGFAAKGYFSKEMEKYLSKEDFRKWEEQHEKWAESVITNLKEENVITFSTLRDVSADIKVIQRILMEHKK